LFLTDATLVGVFMDRVGRVEKVDVDVPEGWYPDPQGLAYERYFDGANWTQATRDKQAAAPDGEQAKRPQIQPGTVSGDFYWTGLQWLPVMNTSLATAWFVRSIAWVLFANIIATAGGFLLVADVGDSGAPFFVVAGLVAFVLLIFAFINFGKGTTALGRLTAFTTGRVRPPTAV